MIKTGTLAKIIKQKCPVEPDIKRDYIGASIIGSPCLRQIYYSLHSDKEAKITFKTNNILKTGKALEEMVMDLMKESGFSLIEPSSQNHNLYYFDNDFTYFCGHADAVLLKPHSILEIKSAKASSFNQFKKHGVKQWQPIYYSQCQSYMGMSGIHQCYILVVNKDNGEFLDELIEFDRTHYDELKHKASAVYHAKSLPPRIRNNPSWYLCQMCRYKEVCYDTE